MGATQGRRRKQGARARSEGSVLHFTDRGGPWRATVPRGRNPDDATQKTDATERVPPGKKRWRAMRCHGRESCAGNPEPFGRDHRRRPCVHKGPRLHAGQMTDATERVCPGKRGRSQIGGPRSLVPATPTTPPRRRTRRSASLHGKTNGGPCSVMAANHVPTTRNLLDEITGAKHVSIKAPGCMPAK